jgi:RNA polymerase-associated protein RTF1
MILPELEREAIISQRLEEKQRILDKVNISMLLKTQRKRPESPEAETVSSAAKRDLSASLISLGCARLIDLTPR